MSTEVKLSKKERKAAKRAAREAAVAEALKREAKENGRATYRQLRRKVEVDGALTVREREFLDRVERAKVKMMTENRDMTDLLDRAELKRKARNDTLRRLCDYGLSEREIGDLIGLSGPRVNQIYFGTNGSKS
jgi:hypothetical protein